MKVQSYKKEIRKEKSQARIDSDSIFLYKIWRGGGFDIEKISIIFAERYGDISRDIRQLKVVETQNTDMMDNRIFKTAVSLNRFYTIQCSSIDEAEFIFTIKNDIFDHFHKRGNFELSLYHNGQQKDLILNGWTFAAVNQCVWIDAMHQKHTHVKINCIDPNGDSYLIEVSENTENYCQAAPALYMNAIMVASMCANKGELKQVIWLFDHWNFPEIPNLSSLSSIERLKVFAAVIKRNKDNEDIPRHFILFAKAKYNNMVKYFKTHVKVEELLKELAPELDDVL